MNEFIKDGERIDELNRNGYTILQHPDKFCFGMDAVLLSDFARAKKDDVCLDLGTGTGVIPILMEAKTKAKHFYALEIQEDSVDMAMRSVAMNDLSEKIDIMAGDIKEASKIFGPNTMDVVTSNPPYMLDNHGLKNPNDSKAIARHEVLCSLDDVIREASRCLKQGGHFYMVHRPFRLVEIISKMQQYKLEPKRMRLVYPFVNKEPNMVLIEGVKGGGPQLTVESPLIVYESVGNYTPEIYDIYGY
ncbi:MAG: tRNA1(Val) (adenine(37)-N6)-methyltransferase [Pseudobutyrivibrio sp.]|nr:tRNA1(Val) (adenine(37)-N6)-methyltransferase [Pseudobutyrivibrio sp.]